MKYLPNVNRAPMQPYHHLGDSYQCTILNEQNEMELVECDQEHLSICKRPAEITTVPPNR